MSIRSKICKLKGGHPIILSKGKRDAYIESLRKQYKGWHKIGALSPYSIPVGEKRQQKRESKISPDIVTFLKNNDAYDEAIFSWPNWKRYIAQARKAMKPEKQPRHSRQIKKRSSDKNLGSALDLDLSSSPPSTLSRSPVHDSVFSGIKPLTKEQKHLRKTKYKDLSDEAFQRLFWDPDNKEWDIW